MRRATRAAGSDCMRDPHTPTQVLPPIALGCTLPGPNKREQEKKPRTPPVLHKRSIPPRTRDRRNGERSPGRMSAAWSARRGLDPVPGLFFLWCTSSPRTFASPSPAFRIESACPLAPPSSFLRSRQARRRARSACQPRVGGQDRITGAPLRWELRSGRMWDQDSHGAARRNMGQSTPGGRKKRTQAEGKEGLRTHQVCAFRRVECGL